MTVISAATLKRVFTKSNNIRISPSWISDGFIALPKTSLDFKSRQLFDKGNVKQYFSTDVEDLTDAVMDIVLPESRPFEYDKTNGIISIGSKLYRIYSDSTGRNTVLINELYVSNFDLTKLYGDIDTLFMPLYDASDRSRMSIAVMPLKRQPDLFLDSRINILIEGSVTTMSTQKSIVKTWHFKSSDKTTTYETVLYDDNSTSCNCPGWTKRLQRDSGGNVYRTCKHTRMVEAGSADVLAVSVWEHQTQARLPQRAEAVPAVVKKKPAWVTHQPRSLTF